MLAISFFSSPHPLIWKLLFFSPWLKVNKLFEIKDFAFFVYKQCVPHVLFTFLQGILHFPERNIAGETVQKYIGLYKKKNTNATSEQLFNWHFTHICMCEY